MQLDDIRKKIDELDKNILNILAERTKLIEEVIVYKKENSLPVHDQEREARLIQEKRELAEQLDLDPEEIEKIFNIILEYSNNKQKEELGE